MSSKVYIVEHRRGPEIDSTIAFVASTKERALSFCLEHKDFDDGNDWWWAIYSVGVDNVSVAASCEGLHFLLPDGTDTDGVQPIPYPKPKDIREIANRMSDLIGDHTSPVDPNEPIVGPVDL